MRTILIRFLRGSAALGFALLLGALAAHGAQAAEPGFIALAADRGFQGNEEIRDAFDAFTAGRNAELVFATDARTREALDRALAKLAERGAKRALVLPVFLSTSDPQLQHVKELLATPVLPVSFARPFGESYLAVEALAERLRPIRDPARTRLATWREDWPEKREPWVRAVRDMIEEAGRDGGRALVIPARTNGRGPERRFLDGMKFELGEGFAPHPLFVRWFEQQVQAGAAKLRVSP